MSAAAVANALSIVSMLLDLMQTATRLLPQFSQEIQAATALVRAAKEQNRDLNEAEVMAIVALTNGARQRAENAILLAEGSQAKQSASAPRQP